MLRGSFTPFYIHTMVTNLPGASSAIRTAIAVGQAVSRDPSIQSKPQDLSKVVIRSRSSGGSYRPRRTATDNKEPDTEALAAVQQGISVGMKKEKSETIYRPQALRSMPDLRLQTLPGASSAIRSAVAVGEIASTDPTILSRPKDLSRVAVRSISLADRQIGAGAVINYESVGALRGDKELVTRSQFFQKGTSSVSREPTITKRERARDIEFAAQDALGASQSFTRNPAAQAFRQVAKDVKSKVSEQVKERGVLDLAQNILFPASVRPTEERIQRVVEREKKFQESSFLSKLTQVQGRAIDKAFLQGQARVFGTAEQKAEAKVFNRDAQSDAFFRATVPFLIPKTSPETGLLKQVKGFGDVEFNLEGTANVGLAGAGAFFAARPILNRPTTPLSNVKGQIKLKTSSITQAGKTNQQTSLQFTQIDPSLRGFFGGKAQTTLSIKDGALVKETVGGGIKKVFTQAAGADKGVLQTFSKTGKLVSTKTQGGIGIGSQVSTAVESSQLSKPVTSVTDDLVTSLQTAGGAAKVKIPGAKLNVFQGDVKFSTLFKTITDTATGKTTTIQSTTGAGVLTRAPIVSIRPPLPVGVGAVSPGSFSTNFAGTTLQPETSFNFPGIPSPVKPQVTAIKLPTPEPVNLFFPSPIQQAGSGFIPPVALPPTRVTGVRQQGSQVSQQLDFTPDVFANPFARPDLQSRVQPQVKPISDPGTEGLFDSGVEPIIYLPPDLIGGSKGSSSSRTKDIFEDITKVGDFGFENPIPTPTPLVPIPFIPLPSFGGGAGSSRRGGKGKYKLKKRPTSSIFQAVTGFDFSKIAVKQDKTRSEQTGIRLRF